MVKGIYLVLDSLPATCLTYLYCDYIYLFYKSKVNLVYENVLWIQMMNLKSG